MIDLAEGILTLFTEASHRRKPDTRPDLWAYRLESEFRRDAAQRTTDLRRHAARRKRKALYERDKRTRAALQKLPVLWMKVGGALVATTIVPEGWSPD